MGRNLPQGLDTPLQGEGGGLSAGEAQLLTFARIFLQDPGVVVLDEPSSRLDPATEKLLTHAMEDSFRPTAIVIAHRLETIERVDKVMVWRRQSRRVWQTGRAGEGPPLDLSLDARGKPPKRAGKTA